MKTIRIKPEREYLREIIEKIVAGVYVIPAFQRDFVWEDRQIVELFDSIAKDYPIGTLILWKPSKDDHIRIKNIRTEEAETPGENAEYYILDGRQRMTAFYRTVLDEKNKPDKFTVCYNAETDKFERFSKHNTKRPVFQLSEIYDTFRMLGLMERINNEYNLDKARKYIEQVKTLNTILQGYTIGEVLIDNCTLQEASEAFSRINSKGTDVTKSEMLQATQYKSANSTPIGQEIKKLGYELQRYNFQDIKDDDVINCCFAYIGKRYYEDKLLESFKDHDIYNILPSAANDIKRAVDFLYNHCHVISRKLLPYNIQLPALAHFFYINNQPDEQQLYELKKWVYYTTLRQTFANGSLSNIRSNYERFIAFAKGDKATACDYETITEAISLDFKFYERSALSCLIIMCLIDRLEPKELTVSPEYTIRKYKGNRPANTFIAFCDEDRYVLNELLIEHSAKPAISENAKRRLLINNDILASIESNDNKEFTQLRNVAITEVITEVITKAGISTEY